MAVYKDRKKYHFRHHIKSKHNALIIGEDQNNFDYIKVTHTPKKDKTHKNNKFHSNPNKLDKKNSYYENKIRIDVKKSFKSPIRTWYLSKEDYKEIEKLLKSKKK